MRLVMLGTGTNVGKTYVTEALARACSRKAKVRALKPIESGVELGSTTDAARIAAAAGHEEAVSPWRFPDPVSPHLAARRAGTSIDLRAVTRWVEEQSRGADLVLIESAGGACSPLARGIMNIDLARALEPALWVVVAPDALGVLHDVTATLAALPRKPDALVLSAARSPDASTGTNALELSVLGIAEVTAQLARDGADVAPLLAWLERDGLISPAR